MIEKNPDTTLITFQMQKKRPKTMARAPQLLIPTAINTIDTTRGSRERPNVTISAMMDEIPKLLLR